MKMVIKLFIFFLTFNELKSQSPEKYYLCFDKDKLDSINTNYLKFDSTKSDNYIQIIDSFVNELYGFLNDIDLINNELNKGYSPWFDGLIKDSIKVDLKRELIIDRINEDIKYLLFLKYRFSIKDTVSRNEWNGFLRFLFLKNVSSVSNGYKVYWNMEIFFLESFYEKKVDIITNSVPTDFGINVFELLEDYRRNCCKFVLIQLMTNIRVPKYRIIESDSFILFEYSFR